MRVNNNRLDERVHIHIFQLFIRQNSNLTNVECKTQYPSISEYKRNYSNCLSCWTYNLVKKNRLIRFQNELPKIVKNYHNSLNYNDWHPTTQEKIWWVTISDRAALANFHVIDSPQVVPTLFDCNYFKTKKDAENLVLEINKLKSRLNLKIANGHHYTR